MSDLEFNINNHIRVKLGDKALIEWQRQIDEMTGLAKDKDSGRLLRAKYMQIPGPDKDGYHRFQMWEFMQKFGHLCGIGRSSFETTLILEVEK